MAEKGSVTEIELQPLSVVNRQHPYLLGDEHYLSTIETCIASFEKTLGCFRFWKAAKAKHCCEAFKKTIATLKRQGKWTVISDLVLSEKVSTCLAQGDVPQTTSLYNTLLDAQFCFLLPRLAQADVSGCDHDLREAIQREQNKLLHQLVYGMSYYVADFGDNLPPAFCKEQLVSLSESKPRSSQPVFAHVYQCRVYDLLCEYTDLFSLRNAPGNVDTIEMHCVKCLRAFCEDVVAQGQEAVFLLAMFIHIWVEGKPLRGMREALTTTHPASRLLPDPKGVPLPIHSVLHEQLMLLQQRYLLPALTFIQQRSERYVSGVARAWVDELIKTITAFFIMRPIGYFAGPHALPGRSLLHDPKPPQPFSMPELISLPMQGERFANSIHAVLCCGYPPLLCRKSLLLFLEGPALLGGAHKFGWEWNVALSQLLRAWLSIYAGKEEAYYQIQLRRYRPHLKPCTRLWRALNKMLCDEILKHGLAPAILLAQKRGSAATRLDITRRFQREAYIIRTAENQRLEAMGSPFRV